MFGYITVNKKQLSDEQIKIYQEYYCGLCRKLKQDYGKRGQLVLNYDMTFLIVLLSGLYEPDDEKQEQFICAAHPAQKHSSRISGITDYAAAMNILLAYYNLVDDWKDDKSFFKKTIAGLLKKDYQKIRKLYPRQVKAADEYIKNLEKLEKNKETNIDIVAGLTGDMLGEIFAWKCDEWYDELKTLGFFLGKFIYIMDAYEDIDRDIKNNSYNPLERMRKCCCMDFDQTCYLMMTRMMSEAAKSFERMPILLHAGIIRNVLYSGVWSKYEYIQNKKKKRSKK